MSKQLGMYNKIRQATTHKPVEMFLNFFLVLFPDNTARPLSTFLTIINNLKLTNINSGRNMTRRIVRDTVPEITKSLLEITYMTVVRISDTARRVSNLRLVTVVR